MGMPQSSASLAHIDNQELARLAGLWHSQALSGQIEARSIAHSFAMEQRRRSKQGFSMLADVEANRKAQSVKNFKFYGIACLIKEFVRNFAIKCAK